MKNINSIIYLVISFALISTVYLFGWQLGQNNRTFELISETKAAGGVVEGSNVVAPDRYVYYPGTETLAEGEIRVIACGTGMPDARIAQASACFLFELGNGDKFIFDIGTGSMRNIASLMIPYEYLTKIFLSHLHTDHWGDLDSLWAGGWTAGRPVPLEIWGPTGQTKEMGTAYAIDHFLKANTWDKVTREYLITPVPGQITVHEFDYKQVNEVVYQENGVTVRSIPAIHAGDGPVSFIVEYAGLKVIFGGDTSPNKWFIEHAKDSDLVIHEAFNPPAVFATLGNQPAQLAWRACCAFHTSGPAFGKIMSTIQPRHAVAYHALLDPGTQQYNLYYDSIRDTYDGPLSIASDLMVWNISKDKITERLTVATPNAWAVEGTAKQPPPDQGGRKDPMSDFIKGGEWGPGFNAQNEMLDEHMEKYNLQDQDWRKRMPWYKPNKN
ncbi:MAG: MBL fold metallo-hydrolase [Gammaproteobacteria bacterium]|nr:MBL fold metallo-hydrolase [Gammaproteobacteria bacterium]